MVAFYSTRCPSAGRLVRTLSVTLGSISATTIPGPRGRLATTLPQGSTIIEWPWVRRPFACSPPCAGAITHAWFSTARARSRISQWAAPVVAVKAEGTVMRSIGASRRYSSGKRTS